MTAREMNKFVLVMAVVIFIITGGCDQTGAQQSDARGDSGNYSRSSVQSSRLETWEWKLACIHHGRRVSQDDPIVARFRRILDRLDRECPENSQGISDAIVRAWNLYQEETVRTVSLFWVAEQLNECIPTGSRGQIRFIEACALWLTLVD